MIEEVQKKLEEVFPKADHKQLADGNWYVPVDKCISRMNAIFKSNWNVEVLTPVDKAFLSSNSLSNKADWVVVHVRISVRDIIGKKENGEYIFGDFITKDGYDGVEVTRFAEFYGKGNNKQPNPKAGQIVNLGNNYKSAVSSAIRVTLRLFGVAHYLWNKDTYENGEILDSVFKGDEGDHSDTPQQPEKIEPISVNQRNAINNLSKGIKNFDLGKYLLEKKYGELDKLNVSQGGEIIKDLQLLLKAK